MRSFLYILDALVKKGYNNVTIKADPDEKK